MAIYAVAIYYYNCSIHCRTAHYLSNVCYNVQYNGELTYCVMLLETYRNNRHNNNERNVRV